jgi:beta-aspartyl-peptidase (threonine type)
MSDPPSRGASRAWDASKWVIVVHGGAGDIDASRVPVHAAGCLAAAEVGAKILRAGGSALDAVEAAVKALEDDPKFNAGTGACLNEAGDIELDASIMEGKQLRAGGVAALPPFANPIALARAVLEEDRHVLYAGEGAAKWAESHGFTRSTLEALRTESALQRWKDVKDKKAPSNWAGGTVGAVARDAHGSTAAATSTGGSVDKRVGRVGDSPLVGAGTYADDRFGAVSTTGKGESFIRTAFAFRLARELDVDAKGARGSIAERAASLLAEMSTTVGGDGGCILVDAFGRAAWARNTKTMSWAIVRAPYPDDADEADSGA